MVITFELCDIECADRNLGLSSKFSPCYEGVLDTPSAANRSPQAPATWRVIPVRWLIIVSFRPLWEGMILQVEAHLVPTTRHLR